MNNYRITEGGYGFMVEIEVIKTKGVWWWKKEFKIWEFINNEGGAATISPMNGGLLYDIHAPFKSRKKAEKFINKINKPKKITVIDYFTNEDCNEYTVINFKNTLRITATDREGDFHEINYNRDGSIEGVGQLNFFPNINPFKTITPNVPKEKEKQLFTTKIKAMIWTEEENENRELDNMLTHTTETCKDCQWGGYTEGDQYITCGHHLTNFLYNSWCSYHTSKDDPKVKAYYKKRAKILKSKLNKVMAKKH